MVKIIKYSEKLIGIVAKILLKVQAILYLIPHFWYEREFFNSDYNLFDAT